jgi:thiol-disulfide isomerase/thioredoxin
MSGIYRAIFFAILLLLPHSYAQKSNRHLPVFSGQTTTGEEFSSARLANKVAIVNFWATWCPPCRRELPILVEMQKQYPEIVVVGISMDLNRKPVPAFIDNNNLNFAVVYGNNAIVEAFGGVEQIPETFIFAKDGTLSKKFTGPFSKKEITDVLVATLKMQ